MAIQYSERDLEDWAEGRIREFLYLQPWEPVIVERQKTLPTGRIIDLLSTHKDGDVTVFTILELKAVTVDARALTQLLDYIAGFVHGVAALREMHEGTPMEGGAYRVEGALVGPDISDDVATALDVFRDSIRFQRVRATFRTQERTRGRDYSRGEIVSGFRSILDAADSELAGSIRGSEETTETEFSGPIEVTDG